MDFPKELIKGPHISGMYKERELLINDINTNPSCDRSLVMWKIEVVTKKLCTATGVPYPKKKFWI